MEMFLSFCNLLMFFCGDFILCICERMPLILFLCPYEQMIINIIYVYVRPLLN